MLQILTHMKEKLQFVEKENEVLTSQLQQLESSMASRRDTLTKLKTTRDTVRARGRAVKDGSTYVANQQLLDDYEVSNAQASTVQQTLMRMVHSRQPLYAVSICTLGGALHTMEANFAEHFWLCVCL